MRWNDRLNYDKSLHVGKSNPMIWRYLFKICWRKLPILFDFWGWWNIIIFTPDAQLDDVDLDVSKNSGTPKLSILIGFSIINHPFWGTFIFGNTHLFEGDPNWFKFTCSEASSLELQIDGGFLLAWQPTHPEGIAFTVHLFWCTCLRYDDVDVYL